MWKEKEMSCCMRCRNWSLYRRSAMRHIERGESICRWMKNKFELMRSCRQGAHLLKKILQQLGAVSEVVSCLPMQEGDNVDHRYRAKKGGILWS